jgi:hypothetical protein
MELPTLFAVSVVPLFNAIGLICEIPGAVLVATEVVNEFRGKQYRDQIAFDRDTSFAPSETEEYKRWARGKVRITKLGLLLLLCGIALQLVANLLQFVS